MPAVLKPMRTATATATVTAILVGGLTACGGGNTNQTASSAAAAPAATAPAATAPATTAPAPAAPANSPRGKYVKKLEALCQAAQDDPTRAAAKKALTGADLPRIAKDVRPFVKSERKQLRKLRAVKAPSADKKTVKAFFGDYDKLLNAYSDVADAAAKRSLKKAQSAGQRVAGLSAERSTAAQALGLKVCGTPP